MSTATIYGRNKADRRAAVLPFVGDHVVVYVTHGRDLERAKPWRGRLLAVAAAGTGGQADTLVLQLRNGWHCDGLPVVAFSLATVAAITHITHDAARHAPYTVASEGPVAQLEQLELERAADDDRRARASIDRAAKMAPR